jgi:hypothetical protein
MAGGEAIEGAQIELEGATTAVLAASHRTQRAETDVRGTLAFDLPDSLSRLFRVRAFPIVPVTGFAAARIGFADTVAVGVTQKAKRPHCVRVLQPVDTSRTSAT